MKTPPDVRDAYVARTAEIHAKLARLQQLADNHFGHGGKVKQSCPPSSR